MNTFSIRSLVYIALCSAIFIAFSTITLKLPLSPVPVTLQTLALILAGMLLRPKAAFISIFIVIILGAVGLPVFGGKSGLAHIFGPTGGYIFYFPFGAMLISYFLERIHNKKLNKRSAGSIVLSAILFVVGSSWLSYLVGVPWFMTFLDDMTLQKALSLSCYPFLIGDAIKALIALIIFITLFNPIMKLRYQQAVRTSSS